MTSTNRIQTLKAEARSLMVQQRIAVARHNATWFGSIERHLIAIWSEIDQLQGAR